MMMDPTVNDSPALTTISEDPSVKESLITSLNAPITPTERFYVRNHFSAVPQIDAAEWRLKVGGLVGQPLELSLEELLGLPSRESVVTLECAGNSRSYLTPAAEGIGFSHGAVSTARWKGVPLAVVLERAGADRDALEVVFHGADTGEEEEDGVVYSTELPYARSLPLATAMRPEILLAYEMNGEPLTTDHGFPLRLLVPRWYGMASVKWLTSIEVVNKPFDGFFQKRRYVFIDEGVEDDPARKPVTTLKVKSIITAPRHGEVIQPGGYVIRGFAWSGVGEVDEGGGHHRRWEKLVGSQAPGIFRSQRLASVGVPVDGKGAGALHIHGPRHRLGGQRAAQARSVELPGIRQQRDPHPGGGSSCSQGAALGRPTSHLYENGGE